MRPAGFLAKRVAAAPDWLAAAGVADIWSVSSCLSQSFADYVSAWRHNGYWLFDDPAIIQEIAATRGIDLAGATFFYYEAHEEQWDVKARTWRAYDPEAHFPVRPRVPASPRLAGFDVVSFSQQTAAECSPLSCNGLAATLPVNPHCLLATLEEARAFLQAGRFNDSEPGPFRIFSVHPL
jgi:hypothetical protein